MNNVVTAISIETINGGGGDDTVTFVLNDGSVNQTINGGGGTNTLNLDGTSTNYSVTLTGFAQVNGHAGTINDNLNVLNNVAGTAFDFGAGNADELHVGSSTGVTVFTVNNIENVFGALSNRRPDPHRRQFRRHHHGDRRRRARPDLGERGRGPLPLHHDRGLRRSTFRSPDSAIRSRTSTRARMRSCSTTSPALNQANFGWVEINFGGADIVLVDINGDGTDRRQATMSGYEMAIELQDHVGTLTNANFLLA